MTRSADDDDARRIVHDHVDASGTLEGADVTTFAADDASLHVVTRQIYSADNTFHRVVGRQTLNRGRQNLARLSL